MRGVAGIFIGLVLWLLPSFGCLGQIDSTRLRELDGRLSASKKSAATVNRFIAAVRTLFAYAKKLGYIEKNPALEMKTVKLPKRMPNFMTTNEVNELCAEPVKDELLWASRDHALFHFLDQNHFHYFHY